ncbi:MAG TPA: glycerate kinase [Cyanobacteria bacterium UBA9971]|nr:glycerate kinase [Cyanobacteria bacterium UBA9971]
MKILLATNYMKGSLSAVDATNIIKKAALTVDKEIQIEKIPIADGGDGTLDAIKLYTDYEERTSQVSDPLGRRIQAKWLIIKDNGEKTAIIEAAQACGLSLLKPEEYNPLKTTTFGVGELINQAVENNCKKIIITVGGSSTNDDGSGILQALGIKLLDKDNNSIPKGGEGLKNLVSIDISGLNPKLKDVKILVACDVKNPLCGKNGASYVYAPQKGANPEQVEFLDKNLSEFADLTTKTTGNDYRNIQGTGAAGGISFALKSFLNAELIDGFSFIADISKLEDKIKNSDFVITTEGRLDSQTLEGKAPFQVAQLAKKYNVPTIIIAGSVENDINLKNSGITKVFSMTNETVSVEESVKNASILLENTAKRVFSFLKL